MLLLLAAKVRIGILSVLAALHALLEGIGDHCQFRRFFEQRVQYFAVLASWIRQTHGIFAGGFQEWDKPVDHTRDGTVADAKQEAQHLVGRILAQPDDSHQDLVAWRQIGVSPATFGPAAVGTLQAGLLGLREAWQHVVE